MDHVLRILIRANSKRVKLFSISGAPVYLSVWFLLGGLPLIVTGEYEFIPVLLICLFLSVFAHEFGHAVLAWKTGCQVRQIYISPVHGTCSYTYPEHHAPPAIIAYGGVLAHFIILMVWVSLRDFIPPPSNEYLFGSLWYFDLFIILINKYMLIFNLMPIPGLDGSVIWSDIASRIKSRYASNLSKRKDTKVIEITKRRKKI
jgi:Zn-dependent protease